MLYLYKLGLFIKENFGLDNPLEKEAYEFVLNNPVPNPYIYDPVRGVQVRPSVYKTIFAGDNGVIYAIQYAGELHWHKHLDHANGTSSQASSQGKKVGTG